MDSSKEANVLRLAKTFLIPIQKRATRASSPFVKFKDAPAKVISYIQTFSEETLKA